MMCYGHSAAHEQIASNKTLLYNQNKMLIADLSRIYHESPKQSFQYNQLLKAKVSASVYNTVIFLSTLSNGRTSILKSTGQRSALRPAHQ